MSTFASPAGTDFFALGGPSAVGPPPAVGHSGFGPPPTIPGDGGSLSGNVGGHSNVAPHSASGFFSHAQQQQQQNHHHHNQLHHQQQQQQQQHEQHRISVIGSSPYMGAAPKGVPRRGSAMAVDVNADAFSGVSATEANSPGLCLEGPSSQFAAAAVRLLWGGVSSEEQNLQLDSPGRAPFLGAPWGFRIGAPLFKAVYEENRNAFSLTRPSESIPLPPILSRLLCRCGAAECSSSNEGNRVCCCRSLPPHGLIPELNRLWVAEGGDLYLWELGAGEEAVERLSFPDAVESVVYVQLDRALLPPALRNSFCWSDGSLSAFSVTAHLDASGCTDSPPYADVSSSPLHCLAISVSNSVRLFAVSAGAPTAGAPTLMTQQLAAPRAPPSASSLDYTEVGAAEKPKGTAPLSLAAAHKGSGIVFFGSSVTHQVYYLDLKPAADAGGGSFAGPLGFSFFRSKKSRRNEGTEASATATATTSTTPAGEEAALRAVLPPNRTDSKGLGFRDCDGSGGFVSCQLVPLNPTFKDRIKGGLKALCVSLGLTSSNSSSSTTTNNSSSRATSGSRGGLLQLEADEARGIIWGLGGDSTVTAFVIAPPDVDNHSTDTASKVKQIQTLRLTKKELESSVRSLYSSKPAAHHTDDRGIFSVLRRSEAFAVLSLSVLSAYEGHAVAAVLTDATGGRLYISVRGIRSNNNSVNRCFAAAALAPPAHLSLAVHGYRGAVEQQPGAAASGSLRCAAVAAGVFVSAYAPPHSGPPESNAATVGPQGAPSAGPCSISEKNSRCSSCSTSCYLGAPCVLGPQPPEGEEGLGGGIATGNSNSSNSGFLCCCCRSRPAAVADVLGPALASSSSTNGGDVLVVAAPDLRALALLQHGNSTGSSSGAATATAAASAPDPTPPGGYFFSSARLHAAVGGSGVPMAGFRSSSTCNSSNSSSSGYPSVCSEWYTCMQLGEEAGRVLQVVEPFATPAFGVLQQSSSIWPSPFDVRKRRQWLSLPYGMDPFARAGAAADRGYSGHHKLADGLSNSHTYGSSSSRRRRGALLSSLPVVQPPSAQSDAAAGALCGAPKLLILTTKFVLQLRRQTISHIYVAGLGSLLREGVQGPLAPTSANPYARVGSPHGYEELFQQQQQQHYEQDRGTLWSVGPQRSGPLRLGQLLAEHMCEEGQFGCGAMFAVFWQLLADNAPSLAAFQSTASAGPLQGSPEGLTPTWNLLSKQMGAPRTNKGLAFQQLSASQLSQAGGALGGGAPGAFETPFGLGYIEGSERQQQQQQQQQVAATVGKGASACSSSGVGLSSAAAATAAAAAGGQQSQEKTTGVAVAWRMLTALEIRREAATHLGTELSSDHLLLPFALQQQQQQQQQSMLQQQFQQQSMLHNQNLQQQAWGSRALGCPPQQQEQQTVPQQTGGTLMQASAGVASQQLGAHVGAPLQSLTNTARGLILFASRLLRPILGTPLVEAALLPCGLVRAERDDQQHKQLQHPQRRDGGSRKRGREFEWQHEELHGVAQQRKLSACLVGRFSAEAVSRLLYKIASLYEVLDAVYTTLFFSFGQRASLQQQQQQLTRGASWGLPNRGLPPHFAALRLSGVPYLEGGPFGSTVGPSAAEVEQQDIIWGLIPLGDAVELSVLYGVSRVLVTASEMLTAYQLLMQQAEYSVQMGTSRCISARLFDSLLSLTLTDLCTSVEARESFRQVVFETAAFGNPLLSRLCTGALFTKDELEAQMLYLQLQRKVNERLDSQTAASLGEVQQFVYQHLMPRLLFLPIEGLVAFLNSLRFYGLLVDVVTAKAASLVSNFSRYALGRRPKWPSLAPESTQQLAGIQNTLVSSCYRHVGECLAQYCKEFEEDAADATPSEAEKKKAESVQSATLDVHQSSKACAAALVNACLASSDENLHNYVVDWIASHGGKNFPVALLHIDGPMADRLLAQSDEKFAIDLGDRYAASGLYAQAAKCHSLQGLRQWVGEKGEILARDGVSGASVPRGTGEGGESADDITTLLAFDAEIDAFCCSITQPIWQFLASWVKVHSQEPSLDRRLLHFVKAKENAQNFLQQSSEQTEPGIRSFAAKERTSSSTRKLSLSGDIGFDESTDSSSPTPLENSIRQIDLNIRMVGIQRALVRDTAHLFCVLVVTHLQSVKKERALLSGVVSASANNQAVSADDVQAFCIEVSNAARGSADTSVRKSNSHLQAACSPVAVRAAVAAVGVLFSSDVDYLNAFCLAAPCVGVDFHEDHCRSLLSLLVDLQRVVYAPIELLDLLNSQINDCGVAELVGPDFPSIAALRLHGQRVASAAARSLGAFPEEQEVARAALDDACMTFLSFGASASKVLQQPRILSDALKDLLALPDIAVRESCSRSLKRLSVVLHVYARTQWGNREVTMMNAEGEPIQIPPFLWPAWRMVECGQSFDTLVGLYLSFEEDEFAKQQSCLDSAGLQTVFCWIFDQWLTSQDDVGTASTYVGLLHELTEAGDLPYFGSPVSVPLWSQLNEEERARADVAAQQLTDLLLQIESAMAHASRSMGSLKDNRHFVGVRSRLAIIKQQVAEYRAALHKQGLTERFVPSF